MTIEIDERLEFAAGFAGAGFSTAARHFRQYEDEDPKVFDAVVKLLGMDRGDADFMVRIDRTFRNFGVNDNHMAVLGWPKLIVLIDHISPGNRQQLLELADKTPAKDLASMLGQHPSGTKRMVLHLTQDQYHVLEEAILAHGGVRSARDASELCGKEEALVRALSSQRD